MAATTDTRQTLAGREDLERFASLAGATPGEIERGFMACEAAGLEPGWYTAARVAGSRHHRFVEMLTGAGHTAEETAAGYVDRLAHNAHPDRAGHQEWVSRVNHRWSAAVERGHDLVDAQLLAAPAPGEASRDRHEQVVYAHLSDRQGTHWFVCELDHTTGTAGVWEWPVGADSEPGWREVSLQDLGMETGEQLVSRHERWQPQSTSGCGVDAYSVETDLLDQVAAKLSHAAGRSAPSEIDPGFARRVAHAHAVATSPGTSVWDRRSNFVTEARLAQAQGRHTYDQLIGAQSTRQPPTPVPVPQTVVRPTSN